MLQPKGGVPTAEEHARPIHSFGRSRYVSPELEGAYNDVIADTVDVDIAGDNRPDIHVGHPSDNEPGYTGDDINWLPLYCAGVFRA